MSDDSLVPRGSRLEYLVAAAFQAQTYLVRRAVPLKYGPAGQDATDIDVLGVKFDESFQPHRIICDCKERQRSRPYERIFWAKGLASFIDASEAYVAVPRASSEVIKFARKGQIRVITQDVLELILTTVYGADWRGYGVADGSFFETFTASIKPATDRDRTAAVMLQRARSAFLVDDPYPALNQCLEDLRLAASEMKRVDGVSSAQYQLWRLIGAENVVLFSLLLLYIASDTVGLARQDRLKHITERLTYGDISPRKAKELFRLAQMLVVETARSIVKPDGIQSLSAFELGEIEPPRYALDICGLVERAIAAPPLYHRLPQVVDYLVFGQALANESFSADEYARTFPQMGDARLKAARNVFALVREHTSFNLSYSWTENATRNAPVADIPSTGSVMVKPAVVQAASTAGEPIGNEFLESGESHSECTESESDPGKVGSGMTAELGLPAATGQVELPIREDQTGS